MEQDVKTETVELEARFVAVNARIEELGTALADAKQERRELVLQAHGIQKGSIVASDGKRYVVESIGFHYGKLTDKPYLKGYPIKKDGTPSVSLQSIGSRWEVAGAEG